MENYNPYRNNNDTPGTGSYPSAPMAGPAGRSRQMEKAASVLGTISLITCTFLYVAMPCGAMAVMFGLLARGNQKTFSRESLTGIILGLAGIGCTVALTLYFLVFALNTYGSLDGLMQAAAELSGVEYVPFFID